MKDQRASLLREFIAASAAMATGRPPAISSARGSGYATQQNRVANVRFGSQADIEARQSDVRFTPKADIVKQCWNCPLGVTLSSDGKVGAACRRSPAAPSCCG